MPALIYLVFNLRGLGAHGWGIPMATDIAFALGALNLIAPQAPIGAKVLLTALAIVDDMGAVAGYLTFLFARDRLERAGRRSGDAARVDWIQSNRYSSSVAVPAGWSRPMVFCSCLRRARHDRRRCPRLHHSYTFAHQRAGIFQTITFAAGSIRSHGNRRPCCLTSKGQQEAVLRLSGKRRRDGPGPRDSSTRCTISRRSW